MSTRRRISPVLHHDAENYPASIPLPPSPLKNLVEDIGNAVAGAMPETMKVVDAVKSAEGKLVGRYNVGRVASEKVSYSV